jgi:hypothetical protein
LGVSRTLGNFPPPREIGLSSEVDVFHVVACASEERLAGKTFHRGIDKGSKNLPGNIDSVDWTIEYLAARCLRFRTVIDGTHDETAIG